jgi:hypothetical protein
MAKVLNFIRDKKSIFVLYSIVTITIITSFSTLYALNNSDSTSGNTNNVTQSMGQSIANKLSTAEIFGSENKLYGLSYEDHVINFWKWFVSIPEKQTPESDETGELCTIGQNNSNSSIFYLSPGPNNKTVERICEVPNGKGILIPVIVVEASDEEIPKIPNPTMDDFSEIVENLTRIAKKDQDGVKNMSLIIDDKEYQMEELSKYRVHTGAFVLNFPPDAIFNATEGPAVAVADGHYIISKPLSRGEHIVHWESSLKCPVEDPECFEASYIQDVKYNIIVN